MNCIRAKLDMNGELAKHLHKTLKKEYLKDTNVNVFLEEEQKESMSGHKFINYYLSFWKPDEEDNELEEIDKISNDLNCMLKAMNENGIFLSYKKVQSIKDRYEELLEESEIKEQI